MPKDNEVDERVVAMVCLVPSKRYPHFAGVEVQLYGGYEPRIGDEFYHAAKVAELRAKADAAERRVGELTSLLSDTVGNLHRMGNNEFADCDQERLDIVISRIERTLTGADPT